MKRGKLIRRRDSSQKDGSNLPDPDLKSAVLHFRRVCLAGKTWGRI
jgi:hypothetical protein